MDVLNWVSDNEFFVIFFIMVIGWIITDAIEAWRKK